MFGEIKPDYIRTDDSFRGLPDSKLELVRAALANESKNGNLYVASNGNPLLNIVERGSERVDFLVAPTSGLYLMHELETVRRDLLPDISTDHDQPVQGSDSYPDHEKYKLHYGWKAYDDRLARLDLTPIVYEVKDEAALNRHYPASIFTTEFRRRTVVTVFPCPLLADIIELFKVGKASEFLGYLDMWLTRGQMFALKEVVAQNTPITRATRSLSDASKEELLHSLTQSDGRSTFRVNYLKVAGISNR